MLVLDVNGLPYLKSLALLDSFPDVLRATGVSRIPWKVYLQLKRSGTLADIVDGWIEERLAIKPDPPPRSGPVGRAIQNLLRRRESAWVNHDLADLECAALAATHGGDAGARTQVFTAERGLSKLCHHLHIETVDVFDVVALIAQLSGWNSDRVSEHLISWQRKDAGNGRPADFDGSFVSTHSQRYGEDGVTSLRTLFGLDRSSNP
ncbi:MAG: hypothetical protein JW990_06745 [Thermoleophilia bacterium]|nr:hypothetical protein [Thermoleophilia bacterium]